MPFSGFDIAIFVLVVLVLALLFAGIKTVPQGYNYTVERFGRYTKTLPDARGYLTGMRDAIDGLLANAFPPPDKADDK